MIGRTLFYGQTDNILYKRSFDGVNFGDRRAVNPYIDPLWNTVLTGSGPVTQTYTGVLPTWYGQLSNVTGMFYANGRLYYTRSGQNSLYWRWFSPDSGIVGGVENTVAGGNITWSSTRGMFLDGSTLYVVSSTNGQLLRIAFVNGAPTGTSTVADADHRLARQGGVPRLGAAERRTHGRLHLGLHGHHVHLRRDRVDRQRRHHPVLRVDLRRRRRGRRPDPGEGLRGDRHLRRDAHRHRRRRTDATR